MRAQIGNAPSLGAQAATPLCHTCLRARAPYIETPTIPTDVLARSWQAARRAPQLPSLATSAACRTTHVIGCLAFGKYCTCMYEHLCSQAACCPMPYPT
jgi:hypothetical protein